MSSLKSEKFYSVNWHIASIMLITGFVNTWNISNKRQWVVSRDDLSLSSQLCELLIDAFIRKYAIATLPKATVFTNFNWAHFDWHVVVCFRWQAQICLISLKITDSLLVSVELIFWWWRQGVDLNLLWSDDCIIKIKTICAWKYLIFAVKFLIPYNFCAFCFMYMWRNR